MMIIIIVIVIIMLRIRLRLFILVLKHRSIEILAKLQMTEESEDFHAYNHFIFDAVALALKVPNSNASKAILNSVADVIHSTNANFVNKDMNILYPHRYPIFVVSTHHTSRQHECSSRLYNLQY